MKYRIKGTDEVVDVVLFHVDDDIPGVEQRLVEDPDSNQGVVKGFLYTKDNTDDDGNEVPDKKVDVADGNYIITYDDGTVALCHPTAFDSGYEEIA